MPRGPVPWTRSGTGKRTWSATGGKEKPELWDDPYFDEFMEESTFASMTFEEQEQYIASMKQKWDYKNSLYFAEQKGLEKGRAEGRAEGREEERIKNAKQFKGFGVAVEIIAQATGLIEDQVRAL